MQLKKSMNFSQWPKTNKQKTSLSSYWRQKTLTFPSFLDYISNKYLSLFLVLKPYSFVYCCVGKSDLSSAVPFPLEKFTFINVSILHVLCTLTLLQIIHKLTVICITCMRNHFALPTSSIVHKLTFINITICEHKLTKSTHFISNKISLVNVLIGPCILSFPLHHSLIHFSFINVSIFKVILSNAVLFTVACFPFINTIIIFEVLFGEFKSVGDDFLSKNFLRQILKFKKNNFECSICNFPGGYEGKLATA